MFATVYLVCAVMSAVLACKYVANERAVAMLHARLNVSMHRIHLHTSSNYDLSYIRDATDGD